MFCCCQEIFFDDDCSPRQEFTLYINSTVSYEYVRMGWGAKYSWKGKKLDSKQETVKRVACLYAARQRLSLRRASEKLEMSRQ